MTGASLLAALLADRLRGRLLARLQWWGSQPRHVPAALLLLGAWGTFYAYEFAPEAQRAEVWNIGGALGRLLLLGLVVAAYRSAPVTAAAIWWAVEDLQVVGCGALWMVRPWDMLGSDNQCSVLLGVPLSLAGLSLGAVLAWVVFKSITCGQRHDAT